ncbi:TPA: glycoside hydrolase family protein [Escherichia coli]|nr:glycoside hydrolase family protein [Escherichia coli]
MSLSPARQHRLRVQAEQAAREGGSVRHASGYDLMLLQLAEDRRRLKGVQSTVKKAEIKVELLPKYAAWAEGVLAVWTDGIGNTSGVIPGKTITERQAAEGLISNVLRVELALERCVKQQPPQKVYDAVVSFAFNVGTGNACSSTLVKLLNQRRWADACRQLPRWVYVKGVFNQGLDNRRAREMAWCLKGAGL